MLAIYTRLSREDADSTSIENQIREGNQFAKEEGYQDNFRIYDEGEGLSGGLEIDLRPKMEQMMKDMQDGIVKAVYTRKQDRLERNIVTWGKFLKVVIEKKIKIYYSGVLQDLNTPEGQMLANIISTTNAYAISKQSFLTKRALHDNLLEGKTRGGIMAYGFGKDENKYVIIDEEEALIVRSIYQMCLDGKGTRRIATILNERGVMTRYQKIGKGTIKIKNKYTGKITHNKKTEIQWAQNTIRNILINPIYIGRKYLGKKDEKKMYNYPVIVTEEVWYEVQEKLKSNRICTGKKVQHRYLLKGILECCLCGRNYYGKINKNTNIYMCSSKREPSKNCGNRGINITALERYIWERLFLKEDIRTPLIEHLEIRKKEDRVKEINEKIVHLDYELEKISLEKKRAIQLAIKGILNDDDIKDEIELLDNKVRDCNKQKKNYKSQLELFEGALEYQEKLDIDLKELNNVSFEIKMKLVRKYIQRIIIMYDENMGYLLEIKYIFGHSVYHLIDKDYKMGLDMNSDVSFIFDDRIDVDSVLANFTKNMKKFLD